MLRVHPVGNRGQEIGVGFAGAHLRLAQADLTVHHRAEHGERQPPLALTEGKPLGGENIGEDEMEQIFRRGLDGFCHIRRFLSLNWRVIAAQ